MVSTSTPLDPPSAQETAWFAGEFEAMSANIDRAVLGKPEIVRLALVCLVSRGHLLLEDLPGTGKTMLARALSNTIAASHARIQFTPDLLPADLTGVTVYDQHANTFEFHPGPIFHHLVLADEINRASPRTQSALLEVMEEGQVTVDGVTRRVPQPFMVIATQNPVEQAGTYALPEAQLDRFLMRSRIGYPDAAATEEMLLGAEIRDRAQLVSAVATAETVERLAAIAARVSLSAGVVRYIRQIAEASRELPELRLGVSARGALALARAAKSRAAAAGRSHVVPMDVVTLCHPVLSHRLILDPQAQFDGVTVEDLIARMLDAVAPPPTRD